MRRERKNLQTFILIQFKLFELDQPFRMLYPRHELVNTKNLVSRWLISNIQSKVYSVLTYQLYS